MIDRRQLIMFGHAWALNVLSGAIAVGANTSDRQLRAMNNPELYPASLKHLAERKGVLFGSAIQSAVRITKLGGARRDLSLYNFIKSASSVFAPGIQMFPDYINPRPGIYDTKLFDEFVVASRIAEVAIRGHVLTYPRRETAVLRNHLDSKNWRSILERRFELIARGLDGSSFTSIDVVNEVIDAKDKLSGIYIENEWYRVSGGIDYIDASFKCAKALWPYATLYWCDNSLEQQTTRYNKLHARNMYRVLGDALSRGVPVEGVNFQSHLILNLGLDVDALHRYVEKIVEDLGLAVMIGELDVRSGYKSGQTTGATDPSTIDQKFYDQQCADLVRSYLEVMLPFVQKTGREFLCWGLSDLDHSWERDPYVKAERPLPFDDMFRPKAMCHAIVDCLEALPDAE